MALSADKKRHVKAPHLALERSILLADSQTVYEGALIVVDTTSGKAEVATEASGKVFAGVAKEAAVSGSSNTTVKVKVEIGQAEWFDRAAGITVADLDAQACLLDDAEVTDAAGTSTADVKVGRIIELETKDGVDGVWVLTGAATR